MTALIDSENPAEVFREKPLGCGGGVKLALIALADLAGSCAKDAKRFRLRGNRLFLGWRNRFARLAIARKVVPRRETAPLLRFLSKQEHASGVVPRISVALLDIAVPALLSVLPGFRLFRGFRLSS
jgi:hypothetical protein